MGTISSIKYGYYDSTTYRTLPPSVPAVEWHARVPPQQPMARGPHSNAVWKRSQGISSVAQGSRIYYRNWVIQLVNQLQRISRSCPRSIQLRWLQLWCRFFTNITWPVRVAPAT